MKKNSVIILGVIAVVLVLIAILLKKSPSEPFVEIKHDAKTKQSMPQIKPVDNSKLPSQLPGNVPWEQGAAIRQNFEATNPSTGQFQATREYVSKKSLADNATIYKKYLEANSWEIKGTVDQPAVKNFYAVKENSRFDITISQTADGIIVNVSFLNPAQ
jgi:hypothetical protein